MAQLLMLDASQVVLRPKHWAIELSALVAGLPGVGAKHQALPVHVPLRNREAGMEAAMLSSDQVDARVAIIIQETLHANGGWFDPAWVSHKRQGQPPEAERMYSRLNKLLLSGQLKPFLDRHPEFAWQPGRNGKGMVVTWSARGCALFAAAAPGSASAAAAQWPADWGAVGGAAALECATPAVSGRPAGGAAGSGAATSGSATGVASSSATAVVEQENPWVELF